MARDPLRARRQPDRPRARRDTPRARRRAPRLDRADPRGARHRARVPGAQRSAAPAADDRGGREPRGVFAASVAETRATYSQEVKVPTATIGPAASAAGAPTAGQAAQLSEEELRAAYEAELSRVSATDIIAQTVVSLINIGARRLGLTGEPAGGRSAGPERDLEQVRDAIDGARALLAILERTIPQELPPLRDALARLQMAYASRGPPERARGRRDGARRGGRAAGRAAGRGAGGRAAGGQGRPRAGGGEREAVGPRALSGAGRAGAPRVSHPAGRHDRLRARLYRIGARPERSGRQMCARQITRAARKQDRGGFLLSSFLTNHGSSSPSYAQHAQSCTGS